MNYISPSPLEKPSQHDSMPFIPFLLTYLLGHAQKTIFIIFFAQEDGCLGRGDYIFFSFLFAAAVYLLLGLLQV